MLSHSTRNCGSYRNVTISVLKITWYATISHWKRIFFVMCPESLFYDMLFFLFAESCFLESFVLEESFFFLNVFVLVFTEDFNTFTFVAFFGDDVFRMDSEIL